MKITEEYDGCKISFNMETIIKLFKKFHKPGFVEYVEDVTKLNDEIVRLTKERSDLLKTCPHPRECIEVTNSSHYSSDGYGGGDYTSNHYHSKCTLCGKDNIRNLKPYDSDYSFYQSGISGSSEVIAEYVKMQNVHNRKLIEEKKIKELEDKEKQYNSLKEELGK